MPRDCQLFCRSWQERSSTEKLFFYEKNDKKKGKKLDETTSSGIRRGR